MTSTQPYHNGRPENPNWNKSDDRPFYDTHRNTHKRNNLRTTDVSLAHKPSGEERFPIPLSPIMPLSNSDGELRFPEKLNPDLELMLDERLNELYVKQLRPSPESLTKRTSFLSKIQKILNREYPDKHIEAHLFGSSVNGLGTFSSDVDICLSTDWVDREYGISNMSVLAGVFRKNGMKEVCTVTKAKVQICKFHDPEFDLSCDVNVNNTQALFNTRLIKAYVDIDPRVRPFVLIIKYWAKRRELNDAARGGTLSSYCWVMMVLNFLQLRQPPILPSLHELYFKQKSESPETTENVVVDGVDCGFYHDLESLRNFGSSNKESLASLVYGFFFAFSVTFNYETKVISVRHGRLLTKNEKGWDVEIGRMCRYLCVEEPFNPTRNLANSADEVSVNGLRKEFVRALSILATVGNIDSVCEPYMSQIPSLTKSISQSSNRYNPRYGKRGGYSNTFRGRGGSMNGISNSINHINFAQTIKQNGYPPQYYIPPAEGPRARSSSLSRIPAQVDLTTSSDDRLETSSDFHPDTQDQRIGSERSDKLHIVIMKQATPAAPIIESQYLLAPNGTMEDIVMPVNQETQPTSPPISPLSEIPNGYQSYFPIGSYTDGDLPSLYKTLEDKSFYQQPPIPHQRGRSVAGDSLTLSEKKGFGRSWGDLTERNNIDRRSRSGTRKAKTKFKDNFYNMHNGHAHQHPHNIDHEYGPPNGLQSATYSQNSHQNSHWVQNSYQYPLILPATSAEPQKNNWPRWPPLSVNTHYNPPPSPTTNTSQQPSNVVYLWSPNPDYQNHNFRNDGNGYVITPHYAYNKSATSTQQPYQQQSQVQQLKLQHQHQQQSLRASSLDSSSLGGYTKYYLVDTSSTPANTPTTPHPPVPPQHIFSSQQPTVEPEQIEQELVPQVEVEKKSKSLERSKTVVVTKDEILKMDEKLKLIEEKRRNQQPFTSINPPNLTFPSSKSLSSLSRSTNLENQRQLPVSKNDILKMDEKLTEVALKYVKKRGAQETLVPSEEVSKPDTSTYGNDMKEKLKQRQLGISRKDIMELDAMRNVKLKKIERDELMWRNWLLKSTLRPNLDFRIGMDEQSEDLQFGRVGNSVNDETTATSGKTSYKEDILRMNMELHNVALKRAQNANILREQDRVLPLFPTLHIPEIPLRQSLLTEDEERGRKRVPRIRSAESIMLPKSLVHSNSHPEVIPEVKTPTKDDAELKNDALIPPVENGATKAEPKPTADGTSNNKSGVQPKKSKNNKGTLVWTNKSQRPAAPDSTAVPNTAPILTGLFEPTQPKRTNRKNKNKNRNSHKKEESGGIGGESGKANGAQNSKEGKQKRNSENKRRAGTRQVATKTEDGASTNGIPRRRSSAKSSGQETKVVDEDSHSVFSDTTQSTEKLGSAYTRRSSAYSNASTQYEERLKNGNYEPRMWNSSQSEGRLTVNNGHENKNVRTVTSVGDMILNQQPHSSTIAEIPSYASFAAIAKKPPAPTARKSQQVAIPTIKTVSDILSPQELTPVPSHGPKAMSTSSSTSNTRSCGVSDEESSSDSKPPTVPSPLSPTFSPNSLLYSSAVKNMISRSPSPGTKSSGGGGSIYAQSPYLTHGTVSSSSGVLTVSPAMLPSPVINQENFLPIMLTESEKLVSYAAVVRSEKGRV